MAEPVADQGFRITTGHVYREVDGLAKRMEEGFAAQNRLMTAHFDTVNVRLDAYKDLPRQVNELATRVTVLEEVDSSSNTRSMRNAAIASALIAAGSLLLNFLT